MTTESPTPHQLIQHAGQSTVGKLFSQRVTIAPDSIALQQGDRTLTFRQLDQRVNRACRLLHKIGVNRADRIAILSENRTEYLELMLAAAKLGAILACQNWRQAPPELAHCISLVDPTVVVTSPRHKPLLDDIDVKATVITLGDDYESKLAESKDTLPAVDVHTEDILIILYTSGTTGLPKGAMISHRAEIVRSTLRAIDYPTTSLDTYAAWAPFYHMAAMDPSIGNLIRGGKIIIIDGFDPARIADVIADEPLGWLLLMPGMIEPLIDEIKTRNVKPKGVKVCGAMADLVPKHQLAEITKLLNAPYVNSFGSTETGTCPCSANLIPIGKVPEKLSKTQNSLCEIKLVDPDDNEVPNGTPGEIAVKGPTLFSGYWRAGETNAEDFRGGWFHLGDMFIRNDDATLDFVDRVKYLIKSGGENIYPAEIERVLLADDRVADAVVVRKMDDKWGEVPVAVVAKNDQSLTEADLEALCRKQLAGYKRPKAVHFIPLEKFPRSTTGKIQRNQIEQWLAAGIN
jgi:fatty-acyl-CoA synthase